MRLLLVEDDPMIGDSIRQGLRQQGFAVDWCRDGKEADVALESGLHELLLLDLGLPRLDGIAVLERMRRRGSEIPVLILTARDAVGDRVKGLDAGADYYLVKPFDLDELAARVRALLRRRSGSAEALIRAGPLCLNPASHEATLDGTLVALSAREFAVLMALLEHPKTVLSTQHIEDKLYGCVIPRTAV